MIGEFIPNWPCGPLVPVATVNLPPELPYQRLDRLAMEGAARLQRRSESVLCSSITGTWNETMFVNSADYGAIASFTTETSLLDTLDEQPRFEPNFWLNPSARSRSFRIVARGIASTTGTPTYLFTLRLGTTAGPAFITGTTIAISAAITTQSGITNLPWELVWDGQLRTPGIGTGNCTLSGSGFVRSPTAFASPFVYALVPSQGSPQTWTSTIDGNLTQYLNLAVTCSASSASNTVTLKHLKVYGEN